MADGPIDHVNTLPLSAIRETADLLAPHILRTPTVDCQAPVILDRLAPDTSLNLKLELFQHAGSFKARSVLSAMLALLAPVRAKGVVAVSSGNHALATAWAARSLGVSAKLVMVKNVNPARVALARSYGADVVIVDDAAAAFDQAVALEEREGRFLVHPFEGRTIALGTGTVATEWLDAIPHLDAVIIAVGGGGLIGGMSAAIKQINPQCLVFGVEPEGAASMSESLAARTPVRLECVQTIADSLGSPYALPYSFGLCARHVDDIVLIPDSAMVEAMQLYLEGMKLMCEPAGAASLAALLGPLRDRLRGARVGALVCGSTIDVPSFLRLTGARPLVRPAA